MIRRPHTDIFLGGAFCVGEKEIVMKRRDKGWQSSL